MKVATIRFEKSLKEYNYVFEDKTKNFSSKIIRIPKSVLNGQVLYSTLNIINIREEAFEQIPLYVTKKIVIEASGARIVPFDRTNSPSPAAEPAARVIDTPENRRAYRDFISQKTLKRKRYKTFSDFCVATKKTEKEYPYNKNIDYTSLLKMILLV